MRLKGYEYQSAFVRKHRAEAKAEGQAEGKAEAVLTVLCARGVAVTEGATESNPRDAR
jgi:hypothetical protein